jgi:hypothetical protein
MRTEDNDDDFVGILLPSDFPIDDVMAVADLLDKAGICVPGYIAPDVGLYHPMGFLYEKGDGIKTVLLPDRNVVSRIAQVIQGKSAREDPQRRVAAALMAFAQCLDIQFEPSIAFHELASVQGNGAALVEYAWFRSADEPPRPREWLDVALGRTARINVVAHPAVVPNHNLERPLRRWRRNYILALKIAELELIPMKALDRIYAFLDWMHRDFILGGPAALLASVYFSPNSPSRKKLMKDLRSAQRDNAIRGIRNATWDLTHLSDFIQRVPDDSSDTRFLFASFDKGLHRVASMLFERSQDPSGKETLVLGLERWWPEKDARCIADRLVGYYQ